MAHPLYLTAEEQKLFVNLPKEATNGVTVVREEREFKDNEKDLAGRRKLAKFKSSTLQKLQSELDQTSSEEEAMEMIKKAKLPDLPEEDLPTLFFLIGPQALSMMIETMLKNAKSSQDVEGIGALCDARSMLLNAFIPS